eukprot:TRINITY_DN12459_c2_g1_i5.p2 TRINITY_DN12459_c2_g1~~TRINITY_DN12459_c2_g1_i5.p2  ORF type:complete len:124 (+),score=18.55 TRINITY_DN12459_c2_g1_i5:427-798(+)
MLLDSSRAALTPWHQDNCEGGQAGATEARLVLFLSNRSIPAESYYSLAAKTRLRCGYWRAPMATSCAMVFGSIVWTCWQALKDEWIVGSDDASVASVLTITANVKPSKKDMEGVIQDPLFKPS